MYKVTRWLFRCRHGHATVSSLCIVERRMSRPTIKNGNVVMERQPCFIFCVVVVVVVVVVAAAAAHPHVAVNNVVIERTHVFA